MKYVLGIVGVLCIAIAADAPRPSWTTRAQVTRVIDGDTVEVEVRRTFRVRLLDCWAPESRRDPRLDESLQDAEKAKGQAAKEHLTQLADGQLVVVQIPMDDEGDVSKIWTMGRVLGYVWLSSDKKKTLNQKQVEAGYATKEKPEEFR